MAFFKAMEVSYYHLMIPLSRLQCFRSISATQKDNEEWFQAYCLNTSCSSLEVNWYGCSRHLDFDNRTVLLEAFRSTLVLR